MAQTLLAPQVKPVDRCYGLPDFMRVYNSVHCEVFTQRVLQSLSYYEGINSVYR